MTITIVLSITTVIITTINAKTIIATMTQTDDGSGNCYDAGFHDGYDGGYVDGYDNGNADGQNDGQDDGSFGPHVTSEGFQYDASRSYGELQDSKLVLASKSLQLYKGKTDDNGKHLQLQKGCKTSGHNAEWPGTRYMQYTSEDGETPQAVQ